MNKKITDYVIDLVEVLNKQQKQIFLGIFDIGQLWSYQLLFPIFYFIGLINPAPVDYVILYRSNLPFLPAYDWILGAEC